MSRQQAILDLVRDAVLAIVPVGAYSATKWRWSADTDAVADLRSFFVSGSPIEVSDDGGLINFGCGPRVRFTLSIRVGYGLLDRRSIAEVQAGDLLDLYHAVYFALHDGKIGGSVDAQAQATTQVIRFVGAPTFTADAVTAGRATTGVYAIDVHYLGEER